MPPAKKVATVSRSGSPTVDELAFPISVHDEPKTIDCHGKRSKKQGYRNKNDQKKIGNKYVNIKCSSDAITENIKSPGVKHIHSRNDKSSKRQNKEHEVTAEHLCLPSTNTDKGNSSHGGADTPGSPSKLKRLKVKSSPSLLEYEASPVHSSLDAEDCQTMSNSRHSLNSKANSTPSGNSWKGTCSKQRSSTKTHGAKRRLEPDALDTSDASVVSLAASLDTDMFHYDTVTNSSGDDLRFVPSTSSTLRKVRGNMPELSPEMVSYPTSPQINTQKFNSRAENCKTSIINDRQPILHQGKGFANGSVRGINNRECRPCHKRYGEKKHCHTAIKETDTKEYSCDLCGYKARTLSEMFYHKTRTCSPERRKGNNNPDTVEANASQCKVSKCKNTHSVDNVCKRDTHDISCRTVHKGKRSKKIFNESVSSVRDVSVECDEACAIVDENYEQPGTESNMFETDSADIVEMGEKSDIEYDTGTHLNDGGVSKTVNSPDFDAVFGNRLDEDIPTLNISKVGKRYNRTPLKKHQTASNKLDSSGDSLLNTSLDWLDGKDSKRQLKWKTVKKYCKRKSPPPSNQVCPDIPEEPEIFPECQNLLPSSVKQRETETVQEDQSVTNDDQTSEVAVKVTSRKRQFAKKNVDEDCSKTKKLKILPSDAKPVRNNIKTSGKTAKTAKKRGKKKRRKPSVLDPDILDGDDRSEAVVDTIDTGWTEPVQSSQPVSDTTDSVPLVMSSDDSSDEDLPDAFSAASCSGLDFLVKGAVVWVKPSRLPYWPAVVRNIYKKKNRIEKVSVIYLEHGKLISKSGITLSYKPGKILPFNLFGDHLKYAEFKEAGLTFDEKFEESVQQVEAFLWHKAQGKEVDSLRYFQADFELYLPEYEERENETVSCTNEPSERTETLTPVSDHNTSSCGSSPEQSPERFQRNVEPQVLRRIFQNQTLVDFIKTERVKEHLLHIYQGKESSHLDTLYRKENQTREEKLALKRMGFGPVVDEMQQDEIISALMEFVKLTDLPYYEQGPYVFSVWLPEAVVFAIQKLRRQSKAKAWETYQKRPKFSKKEIQQSHTDIMNSKSNIDPEDRYRYQLSRERRMQTLSGQSYSQNSNSFGGNLNLFQ